MSNRDDLLRSDGTGSLLETVRTCLLADHSDRSDLVLELVTLHNEGLIDVVAAFDSLKNESSNGPGFFRTRRIFEEALPDLDALVPSVMQCVLHLYQEAGQDGAAGTILDKFIEFCTREPSRPHEALTEIEARPDKFSNLLPAVLIAGSRIDYSSYLREAIRLCENENVELKRGAVFSVGRLDVPEGITGLDAALAALDPKQANIASRHGGRSGESLSLYSLCSR